MAFIKYFSVVIALYLIDNVALQTADYCKLCTGHIGCNNDGNFNKELCSPDVSVAEMTAKRQQIILSVHNNQRNIVAKGEQPGYQPATRMGAMQWDDELAKLAELKAKQCDLKHDVCRNTDRFDYAGQNIGVSGLSNKYPEVDTELKSLILSWFGEQNVTGMEYINSYHDRTDGKDIGHFTQMVTDRASKVGCGATLFKSKQLGGYFTIFFVCDYSVTNIGGVNVYKAGATASECKTGTDSKYNGLCSVNEEYTALAKT